MILELNNTELCALLLNFNNREDVAFCRIYEYFYDELFYFTTGLYKDTEIVASDVIHDIFMKIWESRNVKFNDLLSIKGYLYIAVKNKFRNYISHKKCIDKFNYMCRLDDDYFVSQVVESETLSIIQEAVSNLPGECAKVFTLYIEGWDVKEIADKLKKSQSTVYAQKQEAISILRKKLPKDKMLIITMLLLP